VSGDQESQAERIAALEARVLQYEVEARRTAGDLFRYREAFERQSRRDSDGTLLDEMQLALDAIQNSRFWRLRKLYIDAKVRAKRAPAGTGADYDFRERVLSARKRFPDRYDFWMAQHTPRAADLARMQQLIPLLTYRPTISIIVPAYETPEAYLRVMLDSVIAQVYPHWQLCIVDDASPSALVQHVVAQYAARDPRITFARRAENGHISKTSNDALAMATGEFVALLDHDDVIAPEALFSFVSLLNRHP
jgi:hypothetical protein